MNKFILSLVMVFLTYQATSNPVGFGGIPDKFKNHQMVVLPVGIQMTRGFIPYNSPSVHKNWNKQIKDTFETINITDHKEQIVTIQPVGKTHSTEIVKKFVDASTQTDYETPKQPPYFNQYRATPQLHEFYSVMQKRITTIFERLSLNPKYRTNDALTQEKAIIKLLIDDQIPVIKKELSSLQTHYKKDIASTIFDFIADLDDLTRSIKVIEKLRLTENQKTDMFTHYEQFLQQQLGQSDIAPDKLYEFFGFDNNSITLDQLKAQYKILSKQEDFKSKPYKKIYRLINNPFSKQLYDRYLLGTDAINKLGITPAQVRVFKLYPAALKEELNSYQVMCEEFLEALYADLPINGHHNDTNGHSNHKEIPSKVKEPQKKIPSVESFDKFFDFLKEQKKQIENSLRRVNQTIDEGFVQVGQEEFEDTRMIDGCFEAIEKNFNMLADPAVKEHYQLQLKEWINQLTMLSASISCVMMRIVNNPSDINQKFEDSLSHLKNFNVNIRKAYDVLGFDSKKRFAIWPVEIQRKCNELSEQYSKATTSQDKAKAALETLNQVRQVGFTLSNEFGKELYDAFLVGPETLEMLAISPEDAEKFDINFEALNMQVGTYKNAVSALLKKLEKQR